MSRVGPSEFTLDEIAREAGLTAGALVQRFGSKRELLLALSSGSTEASADFLAELRAQHRSPLAALRAYAECMAGLAASPDAFVRNLAYLQVDLTDPDLRAELERQARATRAGLESLVRAAITARELKRSTRPKRLAKILESMLSGSLMSWAFYREGTAAKWMRGDVDAVLAPYLTRLGGRS
jgi:AcrR family transcriptional regulator